MRIAFKVDRIGFYRMFAPLIEECLRRGEQVVLLHRDTVADRTGTKRDQYADPRSVPAFASGMPAVRQWDTDRALYDVASAEHIDALVTLMPFFEPAPCYALAQKGVAWISLQEAFEFHHFPVELLLRPDAVCMFSEWWIDLVERRFPEAPAALIRQRLIAVGWPELDAFAEVDRAAARDHWGIPRDVPVVTLGSYKYHAQDPWELVVFRPSTRLGAMTRALRLGRVDLLASRAHEVSYDDALRAIRSFCDRNGAVLVSKSRQKDHPPSLERRLADVSLVDRTFHPPTIVELCAISDVFVNFISTVVLEAVFGGATAISPVPPARSWWFAQSSWPMFAELIGFEQPGSLWNFPGVALQLPLVEIVRSLPSMRLGELRADPVRRKAYVEKFLFALDGSHSRRTFDVIAATVERKRTGRATANARR